MGDAAPAQFSDLAPGDTAGVVAMMRQTMQEIDAGLPAMVQRDTVLASVGDSTQQHLTVWVQDGAIRKLVVADSGNGLTQGETDAWFVGGDVAVVQTVTDFYAFDSGRIVLWTDDGLQPRSDVTTEARMAAESRLFDAIRRWLGVFRIGLP